MKIYNISFVFLLFITANSCITKHSNNNHSIPYIKSIVESNDIVFQQPPDKNKESIFGKGGLGMAIGNGRMGGLLFTGYDSLGIQLNHTDFWRHNPDTKKHPNYGARPFGLGKLSIQWDGLDSTNSRFNQTLHLHDAIVTSEIHSGDKHIAIETVFDMDDDLAIFKIKPKNLSNISIQFSGWRKSSIMRIEDNMAILYDAPGLARSADEIEYLQLLTNGKYDSLYSTQATAFYVAGQDDTNIHLTDSSATIKLDAVSGKEILIMIGSSVLEYTGVPKNPVAEVKKLINNRKEISYADFKKKHLDWWENYWHSSFVQIESTDTFAGFMENLWYMHKYTMASTYRGKYPAKFNLSLWLLSEDERDWGGGYWQFNQSPEHMAMFAANHPEYAEIYFKPLHENLDLIKKQTQEIWKHQGAFMHETHSPDGLAYLRNRQWNYNGDSLWTSLLFSSGLEIAYQMYQYAQYTGDEDYLKEKVFPFLRETALFYVHHLKMDENGKYYLYPANAHENFWAVKNPQTDLAAIRRCFPILINLCEKYGVNKAQIDTFRHVLKHLSPFFKAKVTRDYSKPIQESIVEIDTSQDVFAPCIFMNDTLVHNRHSVDTYTSWPFELTTKGHPQYQTAVNTLHNRFFQVVEYELMKEMLAAAVLQLPDETLDLAKQYVNKMVFYKNGVTWPELAANLMQTTNYMFLHSYDSLIQVFPAIPKNWDASYKLRAQGPSIVYATIKSGKIEYLGIECLKDQTLRLKNPYESKVFIMNGNDEVVSESEQEVIEWQGNKGMTYIITNDTKNKAEFTQLAPRSKNKKAKRYGERQIGIDKNDL